MNKGTSKKGYVVHHQIHIVNSEQTGRPSFLELQNFVEKREWDSRQKCLITRQQIVNRAGNYDNFIIQEGKSKSVNVALNEDNAKLFKQPFIRTMNLFDLSFQLQKQLKGHFFFSML